MQILQTDYKILIACLDSYKTFCIGLLDETSDIINKSQLSTVLCFVDRNGEIQEKFFGFSDVSQDNTALGLFNLFRTGPF